MSSAIHNWIEENDAALFENIPLTLFASRKVRKDHDIWKEFGDFLHRHGVTLWPPHPTLGEASPLQAKPEEFPISNGYAYVTPNRGITEDKNGTAMRLASFEYINNMKRAARLQNGQDAVVRIVTVRGEGQTHLEILRKVAREPLSLLSNNHVLPIIAELTYGPVTLCVFPMAGGSGTIRRAQSEWPKSSVGDLVDMIMQALEGLAFIHDLNIAHRDAFSDNFLVQWQPESLYTMKVPVARPRVYLIDFEAAVMFEQDSDQSARTCIGLPMADAETYARPIVAEMAEDRPYDPFKLDIWQLSISLVFDTGIPPIDETLASMRAVNATERPAADEALAKLCNVVQQMPPHSLLIPPVPFTSAAV